MIDEMKCPICGQSNLQRSGSWQGDGFLCGKCLDQEQPISRLFDELESLLLDIEPYFETRAEAARMLSKVANSPAFKELVKGGAN